MELCHFRLYFLYFLFFIVSTLNFNTLDIKKNSSQKKGVLFCCLLSLSLFWFFSQCVLFFLSLLWAPHVKWHWITQSWAVYLFVHKLCRYQMIIIVCGCELINAKTFWLKWNFLFMKYARVVRNSSFFYFWWYQHQANKNKDMPHL